MKKMRRHFIMLIAYIFVFVTICSSFSVDVFAAEKTSTAKLEAVNGEFIIKLKDSKDKSYEDIIKKFKGQITETYGTYVLVKAQGTDINKFNDELAKNKNVEYVEVNALGKKSGVTLDPLAKTQDYLFYSRAIDAWNLLTNDIKSKTVKIAVVDTGVKASHPDLSGKILPGMNYVSSNTNAEDDNGHGTQVAGIIAAKHNNIGINGIAGLINSKIIPVKVLNSKGEGTSFNIAKGIMYAANQGAEIINISINGKGYSKIINDAIQYALSKKCLVIVSAGNNNDYANKYWPCNVSGVFTVGDSWSQNNKGQEVKIYTPGSGTTTDIGAKGYTDVKGSSYSAAVVTGAAALIKAKNPSYSNEQIKSVLVKGTVQPYNFSIKDALTSSSDFVKIVSPSVAKSTTGDVKAKIAALSPSQVKDLTFYLNDNTKAFKTIVSTGKSEYEITIPFGEMVEGINKIKVVATDKTGKKYEDERYFKSISNQKTLSVTVKDTKGNPAKNILVEAVYSNGYGYSRLGNKGVLTNENGQAVFYGLNGYNQYNLILKNGDADNNNNIFFIKSNVSNGNVIIDLSKEAKEISIKALKADNKTPIAKGKFKSLDDKTFTTPVASDGTVKLLVNKNNSLNFAIISEEEGYYYEKAINDLNNTSSVIVQKDANVIKFDISNVFDSQITNEKIFISKKVDNYQVNEIGTFNAKNSSLFLPKGNYNFNYYLKGKNEENSLLYNDEDLSLDKDTNISYGNPTLSIEQKWDGIEFTFKDKKHEAMLSDKAKITFDIKDPNGKTLINDKDYTFTKEVGRNEFDQDFSNYGSLDIKNKINGVYKITASVTYMNKTLKSNTISLTQSGSSNKGMTEVQYKVPKELKSLFVMENFDTLNAFYYLYNKDTKQLTIGGYLGNSYNIKDGSGTISIPTTYVNKGYNLVLTINGNNGGVLYDRNLGTAINGKIYINNDNNQTKKVSLSGIDLNSFTSGSTITLQKKIGNYRASISKTTKDKNNINLWADEGSYDITIKNNNLLLYQPVSVITKNSTAMINTKNLSKLKFILPKGSTYKSVNFSIYNNNNNFIASENIYNDGELSISPNVKITDFSLWGNDILNGISKNYSFDTNFILKPSQTQVIDFNKFTVSYTSYPKIIDKDGNYDFGIKVTNGSLVLKNANVYYNDDSNSDELGYSYDGLKMLSAYNTSGNLVNNFDIYSQYSEPMKFQSYISGLNNGDYTFKLNLFGLASDNTGIKVKVSSSDTLSFRVMDPFDTTKPLIDGKVIVGYYSDSPYNQSNVYTTDRNGYVNIPKNNIGYNENKLYIIAEKQGATAIFSQNLKVIKSGTVINVKADSLLNKFTVKPLNNSSNVSIAYKNAHIYVSDELYGTRKLPVYRLDNSGSKKIYTNENIRGVSINEDNLMLSSIYAGKGDLFIDNKNVSKLKVELDNSNYWSTLNLNNNKFLNTTISKSGLYYLTPGTYTYNYYSSFSYQNDLTIKSGETKTIKFGQKLTFGADYITKSNEAAPSKQIDIALKLKDEYGNKVNFSNGVTAYVYSNGKIINQLSTYPSNDSNSLRVSFNPEVLLDKFTVKLEANLNNTKYTSNELAYTMDLKNYTKISVLDPNKGTIVSGELKTSYGWNSGKIINGVVYINNDDLKNPYNYLVSGTNQAGDLVVYGDVKIDSQTKEICYPNSYKVNVKSVLPADFSYGSMRIFKKASDSDFYSSTIYEDGNSLSASEFKAKYSNRNIWINDGEYIITESINKYDINTTKSYLLAGIAKAAANITLDYSKTTELKVNNLKDTNVSYLNLISSNVGTGINVYTGNTNYISSGVFDAYNFGAYKSEGGTTNYYKKLEKTIDGSSYIINYGTDFKVNLSSEGSNKINPGDNISLIAQLKDQFDNTVSNFYNAQTKVKVSSGNILLNDLSAYNYSQNQNGDFKISINPDVVIDNFNVKVEFEINGIKYTSNQVSYTMNLDGYTKISVYAPDKSPIIKGEARNNNTWSTSKITAGNLYINNSDVQNLISKYSISGTNAAGDMIVYSDVDINNTTKEIIDTSCYKTAITNNLPPNANNISFRILKKQDNSSYTQEVFNKSLNGDSINNFKNTNLWLQNGQYIITEDIQTYDGKQNKQYLLAANVKASSNVALDYLKTTNVNVTDLDGYKAYIEFYSFDIYLFTGYSNYSINISSGLIDKYTINAYKQDGGTSLQYSKKLGSPITGTSYEIKYGNNIKAIADYNGSKEVKSQEEVQMKVSLKDEYKNTAIYYSWDNCTAIISSNGKEVKRISVYPNVWSGEADVNISPDITSGNFNVKLEVEVNGTKYTSNELTYTINSQQ